MAVHFPGYDNFHWKIKSHTSYDTIFTSITTQLYNMEVTLTYFAWNFQILMNARYTGDSLKVLWDSSLVVNAHLFPLAAYDSHTHHHLLCSGKPEMFSFPLPAAGGTGNLLSQPQLTCKLEVTGSLVQFLDCVDTSTVDPAGETTIENKFIPLAKVHSNVKEGGCTILYQFLNCEMYQGRHIYTYFLQAASW